MEPKPAEYDGIESPFDDLDDAMGDEELQLSSYPKSPFYLPNLLKLMFYPQTFFGGNVQLEPGAMRWVLLGIVGFAYGLAFVDCRPLKALAPDAPWTRQLLEWQSRALTSGPVTAACLAVALLAGVFFFWEVLGVWYQKRLTLAGARRVSPSDAKLVMLWSAFPAALLPLTYFGVSHLSGASYFSAPFAGEWAVLILLSPLWSVFISFVGVRTMFKPPVGPTVVWFLAAPFSYYLLMAGASFALPPQISAFWKEKRGEPAAVQLPSDDLLREGPASSAQPAMDVGTTSAAKNGVAVNGELLRTLASPLRVLVPLPLGSEEEETNRPRKPARRLTYAEVVEEAKRVAANPTPTPVPTPEVSAPPAPSSPAYEAGIELDLEIADLQLSRIQIEPGRSTAVINGKTVQEGHDYGLFKVLKIEPGGVTIRFPGKSPLQLAPEPIVNTPAAPETAAGAASASTAESYQ